jgi:hypothetical protein
MRVLIYKRTHDDDPQDGCFGCYDCLGRSDGATSTR